VQRYWRGVAVRRLVQRYERLLRLHKAANRLQAVARNYLIRTRCVCALTSISVCASLERVVTITQSSSAIPHAPLPHSHAPRRNPHSGMGASITLHTRVHTRVRAL
jgi:hypothetical protein